jgi:hypothetical protein
MWDRSMDRPPDSDAVVGGAAEALEEDVLIGNREVKRART